MKLKELSDIVAEHLFNARKRVIVGEIDKYDIKKYAGGECRGVDIGKYRFMTQNKSKDTVPAKRARKGEQIMWIFKSGHKGYYAGWFGGKMKMYTEMKGGTK